MDFFGPGNQVVTKRSLTRDANYDLGSGADVMITGGGKGHNVEVNGGNDADIDKIYNESLPEFPQGDGSILPWAGNHVIIDGVERGFHTYHMGMNDQGRITLPDRNATAANGGYKMANVHTHGIFVIHGPGSSSTPTIIKSFDYKSQKIGMSSGTIQIIASGGTVVGKDYNVAAFILRGTTGDPSTNGQYIKVDMTLLNPSQQLHVTIPTDTPAARNAAVQNFLFSRGIVFQH
jgi:hypothetical protein